MTKRNRRVAHRVSSQQPAPDEHVVRKHSKATKPHSDWVIDGIAISDHAVVRFMSICGNLDMQEIRRAILAEGRAKVIKRNSYIKLPMKEFNNARVVVRNGVVVTVLKAKAEYSK